MKKINIAELLRNCPKGMELDCTIWDNVTFECVDDREEFSIIIRLSDGCREAVTDYGCYSDNDGAKCVIFPKGKTTWEGFVPPCKFKNGDVIVCENHWGQFISIFKENVTERNGFIGHCVLDVDDNEFKIKDSASYFNEARFATKREKELLFRAIERNGYKWNEETKTLDKLQRKFDITNLKPFDKVLSRDNEREKWIPALWGFYDVNSDYPYKLIGCIARYCIPYEGNEHLLGKIDDCDECFNTWK